jgi:long-chain acyl-CoA synthetase
MNLTELLDTTASRWPKKPALIEGATVVSYAELVEKTNALASQLETILSPGSRVGLCCPNSIAYVALTFALWRVNAVVVPIPTECTEEELSNLAATMRLEAILSQKPREHSAPLSPDFFFTKLTPPSPPDNHGLNIAFIRFTSGTTSARKGVVLCHETIRNRVIASNQSLRITPDDTVMWCLPMSHHFLVTIVLYVSVGATIVLARHIFAQPFLAAVNRWHGTVLYAAPFHYALLARDNSGVKLSSVRLAVSTTCALPPDVGEDFFKRFDLPLTQALGLIELGLPCINVDDPAGRRDSAGRPQPDYTIRILNPDSEGYGEVVVAGPGFFDAYDNPWTPREELMPDGWFATGDIGRLDADGYLFLAGRKAAVINLAGRKVFPEEIEAVLNRHPAVRESRVYGVAHPHLGESVAADVTLREGIPPDALRDFCRIHLGADKVPGHINFVNHIAKTAVTGKIRRQPAPALV